MEIEPPDTSDIVIRLCIRGLKRSKPQVVKRAHPITPAMLEEMARLVDPADPFQWSCWTATLVGFFTFARRSNLVPRSSVKFNPDQQLQRADIVRGSQSLAVIFKWSKTIQCKERVLAIPLVPLPHTNICPVAAVQRMCALVPLSPTDPAFAIKRAGKVVALSQGNFQEFIKTSVAKIGLDPTLFSSHSLRRGGASWANHVGCTAEQIRHFGDWRSDCFSIYIESNLNQRTVIANRMAQHIIRSLAD